MKNDFSLNILFVGMMIYFVIMEILNGHYGQIFCVMACMVLYFAGALLGGIKKYIPIALSIIFIPVIGAAGVQFFSLRTIADGFLSFCTVIMLFSIAGYINITGVKCVPYALCFLGSVFVFCINQNSNGIIILFGMVIAAIMLLDATYTAVSKYVQVWFFSFLILKLTGIVFFLKQLEIRDGLFGLLAKNEVLYVVLVILGFACLLLRERHPRIKSDRDKKHIPSLKRWQTVTGITFAIMFFWGILNMKDIFSLPVNSGTKTATRVLLNIYVYINNFAGSLDNILSECGAIALFLTIELMFASAYKALANYRRSHAVEDKLLGLLLAGYIVSFVYLDLSVPMTLFAALTAGCVVNGNYPEEGEQGKL